MHSENQNNRDFTSSYEAYPITKEEARVILNMVQEQWPELFTQDDRIIYKALNTLEVIAIAEGVNAVTLDRIQGLKEIYQEYLIPFSKNTL